MSQKYKNANHLAKHQLYVDSYNLLSEVDGTGMDQGQSTCSYHFEGRTSWTYEEANEG
jgi:hypothetical protein